MKILFLWFFSLFLIEMYSWYSGDIVSYNIAIQFCAYERELFNETQASSLEKELQVLPLQQVSQRERLSGNFEIYFITNSDV